MMELQGENLPHLKFKSSPLPAGIFEDEFPNFPFGGIC